MKTNRILSIIIVVALVLTSITGCASVKPQQSISSPVVYEDIQASVTDIAKYGNLSLDTNPELLLEKGYEFGDILQIQVGDKTIMAPLCTNYSDVDTGSPVVIIKGNTVIVAINMGDFATANGLAKKEKHSDGSYSWIVTSGNSCTDIVLTLSMGEKAGYLSQYLMHNLTRTNNRQDYESDEVFANFRNIKMGSIGSNTLYRSSSPINPELERNLYADAFVRNAGIKCALNLADNPAELKAMVEDPNNGSDYYKSLCNSGKVIALGLSVDYKAKDFAENLVRGFEFIAVNDGPYVIHCTEGKDRAGFVSALLEALMGATEEEIAGDYMQTYTNYYKIDKGTEKYEVVKASTILQMLDYIKGDSKTLQAGARAYLLNGGMTADSISRLKENLSRNN